MGWQQVRVILFFWMVWARYILHQDGTLHLQWVIIRFHFRKLIKNSFEGFLNDIGEHIKTASGRHSYGDISVVAVNSCIFLRICDSVRNKNQKITKIFEKPELLNDWGVTFWAKRIRPVIIKVL